ncbi:cytochrome P450 [Zopfochytrium polystomum]|nr:cytochrome P450 [Zopfochytrium polystomum]
MKYTVLPTDWIFGKKLKRAPGNLPFFGNTLHVLFNLHRSHDMWSEAFDENNDETIVLAPILGPPGIMINDPVLIEHFQRANFEKFEKGVFFRGNFHDLLANGIFNSDGEQWRRQRKLAANIFNVKNFKDFVEHAFAEEMRDLVMVLDKAADSGEAVNLNDLFFRFTMDGFCKIAFGTEINCLTAPEPPPFARSFDRTQVSMLKRFAVPFAKFVELVTPEGWQFRRDLAVIQAFSRSIVDRRFEDTAADPQSTTTTTPTPTRHDLLGYMMQMPDATGSPIGRAELSTNLINFLFAGRDTTGLTLTWTFLMLARHPSVLEKLVTEIDAATAGLDDGATVSYAVVRGLAYANAVMHETLRLYPPVPYNLKEAVADDVFPDGTRVRKGMGVTWGPYALGRSKKIWGDDAREFRPERWLEMKHAPSAYAYNVFNPGPRICLGKSFAEIEVVFVLVELLRRFKFDVRDVGRGGGRKSYSISATLALEGSELLATVSRR